MVEVGNFVTLTNDKEYLVANILDLHNIKYGYLISNFKPTEVVIATIKNVNGTIILEEIKDNTELEYILSQFAINTIDE